MCQRTHLWCAGVPRLDQRRRQESVPEALYVNACCPSQLLSANQVTQRWTLTSPEDLPPTFFTYKPPHADRWTDRQRQTSVNELTERIEAGYPRSAQRGWIRPTDVTEWGGAGNKTCFHPVFYFTLSLLTHSAFIRFTHLRCWIISVRANVFMHFSSCSRRFWKWCKIRMSINKIS